MPSRKDTIKRAVEINEARENAPFNGVLGSPPDWFPDWHVTEFRRIRNNLLDTPHYGEIITPEKAVEWLNEWASMHQQSGVNSHSVPIELQDSIGKLSHYRFAASLPEIEGLRLLAGELAVRGQAMSQGGSAKKGNEYEPKASIRKICTQIESQKLNDVLDFLRSADQCADFYESTTNPIGVQFIGVDDEAETIEYLKRGQLPDNPKTWAFRTLKNYLSQIKKD